MIFLMAGMIGFNMHKEDFQLLIDADSTPERLALFFKTPRTVKHVNPSTKEEHEHKFELHMAGEYEGVTFATHVDVTYPAGFGFFNPDLGRRYFSTGFAVKPREGDPKPLDLFDEDCAILGTMQLLRTCADTASYAMTLKLAMEVYLEVTQQKEVAISELPTI